MARIAYPDPAALKPEIADRLKRMGSLNVTTMMAHNEGIMLAYSKLGTEILLRGKLDPVLREAVILRVGQLCGSQYEWYQHVSVARAVGMSAQVLDAIDRRDDAALPEAFQVALRFVADIDRDGAASAETFAAGQAHFDPAELVELTIVIGFYRLTASYLMSFDIEVEDTPPLGDSMGR